MRQILKTEVFNPRGHKPYRGGKPIFSDQVIEHFICPRNVYSIPDADGIGSVGDPACGDALTIYIKVEGDILKEVSFMVFGCVASIATSSVTTVLTKGKTIKEALEVTEEDIINALGGLPEEKIHCSNLGVSALKAAIDNYYENNACE